MIWFGYYYFWLVIFAIVSETIIGLYYRYSTVEYPTESGYGIWDYFIEEPNYKKVILLLVLLGIASIFEEIVFRFFFINILIRFSVAIPIIIIITALVFGLAHYNNGGWIYTVNSTFAGFIFAFTFIQFGLITVWILHFLWNFLVVYQMYLPQLYEKTKTKTSEKKGTFIWKPR
jgi:membrane protease YdiL (CAAX protease family)